MILSDYGKKLTSKSGILQLMDDLGKAMSGQTKMLMLGGGNPAVIEEMQQTWLQEWERLQHDLSDFTASLAFYDTPQGSLKWRVALAELLRHRYAMPIDERNIVLTNGSQNAFFILFNLFSGRIGTQKRKVLFPLAPEYIGYADQSLDEGVFVSHPPKIELLESPFFKYHVDFYSLHLTDDVGLICVSRPTNPSGNVLTDSELRQLLTLARQHEVPLVVDNAYGAPFPGILFTEVTPFWEPGMILSMSLSKLGLPGLRTGIIIAEPEIIDVVSSAHAVMNLAGVNLGASLTMSLIKSGQILDLAKNVIKPYYFNLRNKALAHMHEAFAGRISYQVHLPEGALFLWVKFPELRITSRELYQHLKERGVLVVPGEYFFFGSDAPNPDAHCCVRLTYSQGEEVVAQAMPILAEVVEKYC